MIQASSRQPARGQRMSPGYSMPLEMCNTLYLQGAHESLRPTQTGQLFNFIKIVEVHCIVLRDGFNGNSGINTMGII